MSSDRSHHARNSLASRNRSRRPAATPQDKAQTNWEGLDTFRTESTAAIQSMRGALEAVAETLQLDLLRPQEVARRLQLNKNLTWKFARLMLADDPLDAIPMLPGPEGVDIFLRAATVAGGSSASIESLRDAIRQLHHVIARHFGSRAELELLLDGLRTGGNLESARVTAFRGAAGVFGIQAAARVTAQIISPDRETSPRADAPTVANVSIIAGLCGLRRLRPMANLPFFRLSQSRSQNPPRVPLFPSEVPSVSDFLIGKHTSVPHGNIDCIESDERLRVQIRGGPVGRIGDADIFFGTHTPKAMQLFAQPGDEQNDLVTSISVPSEFVLTDVFFHRSIQGLESLRAAVHSTLSGPFPSEPEDQLATVLPITCTIERASNCRSILSVDRAPRYATVVEDAFRVLGEDMADYHLVRVAMDFPPVPSCIVVGWELPRA